MINNEQNNQTSQTPPCFIHSVSPRIVLFQQWEEDPDDKTGWSTWGWEYENGNLFDEVGYELEEVLEEDKYGHITKARFKYVG